ncbi:MAG: TetR family transcriptional regulator [Proteobacteria bacterium]|nr:TetR family transcriptional regulator [Pseudomonadota bacterium]
MKDKPLARSKGTAPASLPLRERRRLETRRELIEVSLTLFAKQGFEATTIGQIAEAAGISVATFHRYFPKKEDVVFSDVSRRAVELRESLMSRPAGTTLLSALKDFFVPQLKKRHSATEAGIVKLRHAVLESSPSLRGLVFENTLALTDALCEVIAAEQQRNAATDSLPRLMAGSVIGALTSTGWFWDTSADVERRFDDLFDFLEKSMGPLIDSHDSRARNSRQLSKRA